MQTVQCRGIIYVVISGCTCVRLSCSEFSSSPWLWLGVLGSFFFDTQVLYQNRREPMECRGWGSERL